MKQTTQEVQYKSLNSRDLAILHESKIFKSLLESAEKKRSEYDSQKRNPILQNNSEEIQQFKPSLHAVESVVKYSSCKDENVARSKKIGEFNERFNPRSQEPKPQGIKAFNVLPPESRDEYARRQLKAVRTKSAECYRNPITEGDQASTIIRRPKKFVPENDHHQRINDRKYLLPADREEALSPASPHKGRLFRESTIGCLGTDSSFIESRNERVNTSPERPVTAFEQKMRGHIRGVLQYEDGPKFRDHNVTTKCNTVKFSEILNRKFDETDRIFARKSTLH